MPAAFMWDDKIAGAAFLGDLGTMAATGLPLSNLTESQPRQRTRWQPASLALYVDFGAATTVECLALISTNLTGGSNIRWRIGNDAGFATSTYDTGVLIALTAAGENGNVILLAPAATSGRFMRLDIAATGDFIDIGRLIAGPLWRMIYGASYGFTEGRTILDRRDRNPFTGAEFPVPAVYNPRETSFTMSLLSPAEIVAQHRHMLYALGAAGDALWIPDTRLSLDQLNIRCIWGAVSQPGASAVAIRGNSAGFSRSFTLTERV